MTSLQFFFEQCAEKSRVSADDGVRIFYGSLFQLNYLLESEHFVRDTNR